MCGARVVVDDDRQVRGLGDGAEEFEHLIVGQRLIAHRCQQQSLGSGGFGGGDIDQDVSCPQRPDADEDGDVECGFDAQLRDPGALIGVEVRVRTGRTQRSDRVDSGEDETFNESDESILVEGFALQRSQREGAQTGEQGRVVRGGVRQ